MTPNDTPPPGEGAPDPALQDGAPPKTKRYVQYSRKVADAICARMAAGEGQRSICSDRSMPSLCTLQAWTKTRPAFAANFARARALGGRDGKGRSSGWDPVTAQEVVIRVSEGEPLCTICDDPAMPHVRTVFLWRQTHPDFEAAIQMARETVAERFSDLGWKMAMEATPETAYLTHVRLNQLRWQAALLAPRTHGRLKPLEPPKPPEVTLIKFRHFTIEENPDNPNQHRVVAWTPNPHTMIPERDNDGPWKDRVDSVQKAADLEALWQNRKAAAARIQNAPDDPEGWR